MQIQIKVIATENETVPNKSGKGSYQKLTVTYKDLNTGKVDGRQLFGFGDSERAYKALVVAQANDLYTVEATKGEKYWQWTDAWKSDQAPPPTAAGPVTVTKPNNNAFQQRDFETKEERKVKQVYIVRQSSISSAIALLGNEATVEQVLDTAKKFEEYVLDLVDDNPDEIEVK